MPPARELPEDARPHRTTVDTQRPSARWCRHTGGRGRAAARVLHDDRGRLLAVDRVADRGGKRPPCRPDPLRRQAATVSPARAGDAERPSLSPRVILSPLDHWGKAGDRRAAFPFLRAGACLAVAGAANASRRAGRPGPSRRLPCSWRRAGVDPARMRRDLLCGARGTSTPWGRAISRRPAASDAARPKRGRGLPASLARVRSLRPRRPGCCWRVAGRLWGRRLHESLGSGDA